MTAKEYLSQAYSLRQIIDAKLEQVQSLRNLATNVTQVLSHTPPRGTRNVSRMEDIIIKMVDLEAEMFADIEVLVDLKREIVSAIKTINNDECRTLLELRYLCFKPWNDISDAMMYSIQRIYQLHKAALALIIIPVN